jgi:hypothetical protein
MYFTAVSFPGRRARLLFEVVQANQHSLAPARASASLDGYGFARDRSRYASLHLSTGTRVLAALPAQRDLVPALVLLLLLLGLDDILHGPSPCCRGTIFRRETTRLVISIAGDPVTI